MLSVDTWAGYLFAKSAKRGEDGFNWIISVAGFNAIERDSLHERRLIASREK